MTHRACPNCDDRKCMDCVFRVVHDRCVDDCPVCTEATWTEAPDVDYTAHQHWEDVTAPMVARVVNEWRRLLWAVGVLTAVNMVLVLTTWIGLR